jgi:OCT family organic cation transporter-like MFS transporter 4/5
MVYYGISMSTSSLNGDPYLNAIYMSLVEFAAIIVCQFAISRFGRKRPYAINMLLGGVSLLVIQFVPSEAPLFVNILALISKFAISFTYSAIYIVTAEVITHSIFIL